MDESEYKVSRLLGPLMELAVTEQKGANISVDCRLYFRLDPNDGRLKGEVAFLDRRTGKLVKQRSTAEDSLPLDSEQGMLWFLDKIGRHGLISPAHALPAPTRQRAVLAKTCEWAAAIMSRTRTTCGKRPSTFSRDANRTSTP